MSSGAISNYGSTAGIGKHWWDNARQSSTLFNGIFDDIRIYNRALTASDISELYGNYSGGGTTTTTDTTSPTGSVSGISGSYTSGNTVSYSVSGSDNSSLSSLAFAVTDSYGSTKHSQSYTVSGTSTAQSNSFSTSGWSAGTYSYSLTVTDSAGNAKTYTGSFSLTSSTGNGGETGNTGNGGSTSTGDSETLTSGKKKSGYAAANEWRYYTITSSVMDAQIDVAVQITSGDADLFIREGDKPTEKIYDCMSAEGGRTPENCSQPNTGAVTWHIGVRGYKDSNYKVTATLSKSSAAQEECDVSGSVLDTDGYPVVKALATLSRGRTTLKDETDAEGYFCFDTIRKGTYRLYIAKRSYDTNRSMVNFRGDPINNDYTLKSRSVKSKLILEIRQAAPN